MAPDGRRARVRVRVRERERVRERRPQSRPCLAESRTGTRESGHLGPPDMVLSICYYEYYYESCFNTNNGGVHRRLSTAMAKATDLADW